MTTGAELEVSLDGLRVVRQADWATRFPGLVQGLTGRAAGLDFSLPDGWARLLKAARVSQMARCRQVHGSEVILFDSPTGGGAVQLAGDADALVCGRRDVLLAVTVADCVPVFIVDTRRGSLGLVHAGWRGIAAGVVEAALERMRGLGSRLSSLHLHLGPAICGKCYEVGPEVASALGVTVSDTCFVDLRGQIARRAAAAGVDSARLTVSARCTRCERERFFSYRGGDEGQRMCAFLGWQAS